MRDEPLRISRELFRTAAAANAEGIASVPPLAVLASGRRLHVLESARGEELTVTSPDGNVELKIRFTAEGPVLSMQSARLELQAARELALDCERFTVHARDAIALRSGGEVVVRGDGDVQVDGDNVLLNCGERPAGGR